MNGEVVSNLAGAVRRGSEAPTPRARVGLTRPQLGAPNQALGAALPPPAADTATADEAWFFALVVLTRNSTQFKVPDA